MLTINQQSTTYGMMITAKTFYSYFHKLLNFPNYNFLNLEPIPIFSPYPCKHYSRERESGENARKMGEKEMENFPLRVFIFFLKGKYIFP